MRRLVIIPDKTSYSADMGSPFARTDHAGPASRFGARPRGAADVVEATWVCDPTEYAYLRAFFRSGRTGALPFTVALAIDDSALLDYQALFVPGSFALRGTSGASYTVSARLVASRAPSEDYDAADDALQMLLAAYGGDADDVLDLLARLVNEEMPA